MSFAPPLQLYPATPSREGTVIIALVLSAHVLLALFWMTRTEQPHPMTREMTVSLSMQSSSLAPITPILRPSLPHAQSAVVKSVSKPDIRPVVKQAAALEPVSMPAPTMPVNADTYSMTPVSVSVPDTEPEYRAAYLNNPRPDYPMVAQRMGWVGRVLLDVEVLSTGACGSVQVFSSSGHEILDKAAMNAVKSWQFVPARHEGRAVTQVFRIPVNFSLKDNEA